MQFEDVLKLRNAASAREAAYVENRNILTNTIFNTDKAIPESGRIQIKNFLGLFSADEFITSKGVAIRQYPGNVVRQLDGKPAYDALRTLGDLTGLLKAVRKFACHLDSEVDILELKSFFLLGSRTQRTNCTN